MKGLLRKALLLMLAVLTFLSCSTAAYADYTMGDPDADDTWDSFASEYGWDEDKSEDAAWIGEYGGIYIRSFWYQQEFFEDSVEALTGECEELGIISKTGTSGSSLKIVQAALAQQALGVQELGENEVMYNTWYWAPSQYNALYAEYHEACTSDDGLNEYITTNTHGSGIFGPERPWCAAFIAYIADQCGLIENGTFSRTASSGSQLRYLIGQGNEHGLLRDCTQFGGGGLTAQPGDIIVWRLNENGSEGPALETVHIGIVTAATDSSISVTQGNSYDCVRTDVLHSVSGWALYSAMIVHVNYPETEMTESERADQCYAYLTQILGLPEAGAIGVMANIWAETRFNADTYREAA